MARWSDHPLLAVCGGSSAGRGAMLGSGVLATVLLAGCVVDAPRRQPVHEFPSQGYEPARRPGLPVRQPETVYTGWRLYQERCASCHGPAGRGSYRGPDLLPTIRTMDSRRFITHVLYRYEWGIPEQRGGAEQVDSMIIAVDSRQRGELTLPATQGEPRVNVYIADLFSYLSARANGTQGPWRP